MLKNGLRLVIMTLLLATPVLANAWTLTVKVTGGSLTPANTVVLSGGASKTVASGNLTVYPTSATTIAVNTSSGYTSSATLDGVAAPASPFSLSSGSHTVTVSYSAAPTSSLSITQNPGGSVNALLPNNTWSSTGATGLVAGIPVSYSIAADSVHEIVDYTVNGTKTVVNGTTAGQIISRSFNLVAGSNTVTATFGVLVSVSGSLSAPTNGYTTQPVDCSLTATTNDTGLQYAFSVTGPATFSRAASPTQTFSFTPVLPGTYVVSATVTSAHGGNFTTSASVSVSDYQVYLNSQCVSCHSTQSAKIVSDYQASKHSQILTATCTSCHTPNSPHSVGINDSSIDPITFLVKVNVGGLSQGTVFCVKCHNQSIVTSYNASPHKSHSVVCSSCHTNGVHNADFTATACGGCHFDASGNVPDHPFAIGGNPCNSCHDPHALTVSSAGIPAVHFNNLTGAGYPASYVTSRTTCIACHSSDSANLSHRTDWARSTHADTKAPPWTINDYKTMSGCVQCHTTTGFIAYSSGKTTAAWGNSSDKTKEVLSCAGCHSDISTGKIRTQAPIHPYVSDPGYLNPDLGKSNICMPCHSSVNDGKSITARLDALADFTHLPFIDPHYMGAGGVIYGQVGYHFPGRSYNAAATHVKIGSSDGSGPCIGCHKNTTYEHQFHSGAIPLCSSCHGNTLNDTKINADMADFLNVLEVLRAQLAAKGFVYTGALPSFNNTNWGAGQAGANNMGAAFNYSLFTKEPGAFHHNPAYARQLILDSIDYLDNGQFDDSVTSLAVPTLLASHAISQAAADSTALYKSKSSCTACHGGTAATATPMATNAHPAHLTGSYGPGFYLGNSLSSCQSCHLYGPTTHLNGSVDLVTGAGSACAGCHPGTLPAWSGGARLACTTCHAAVPSVLPNGVAAPYKANFSAQGHGKYPGSNQCTGCHDPDSRHISGSLGSYTRLRLTVGNTLCVSCHNDAKVVGARFLNMSTHFTSKGSGQTMACATCHDPHGTSNLSMIRTVINGTAISYTDSISGLVNLSTNQGLCQVCHTQTAHYRAGVTESNHPVSGCLDCHRHNSAGGAFRPSGNCNACHGYPPAPRRVTNPVAFGIQNNWSGARFEDYSGGGGAHLVAAHIAKSASPTEGWQNCTLCHNSGLAGSSPHHNTTLPLSSHISNVTVAVDPKYRFNNSFTVYTGARLLNPPAQNRTGSCFNISCHLRPSPRWGLER